MRQPHHVHHSHHSHPFLSTFDYACIDELQLYSQEEDTINQFKEWDKELVLENQHLKEENEALKAKLCR